MENSPAQVEASRVIRLLTTSAQDEARRMTTERSATYVSTIIVNSAQQVPGHRESFKFNEFNTGADAREMRLCPSGFTHSDLFCSVQKEASAGQKGAGG